MSAEQLVRFNSIQSWRIEKCKECSYGSGDMCESCLRYESGQTLRREAKL